MNYKKILKASIGPIKVISIIWVFLILIVTFIYFIFFVPQSFLYPLSQDGVVFGIVSVAVSGVLFLYWLIVWNIIIKSSFHNDLQYSRENNTKLE
ncbi:MAG: hypothetical protein U9O98_09650 [Asgard group archaeon]|nr:hypothetical protein [Asgard group archaeon]